MGGGGWPLAAMAGRKNRKLGFSVKRKIRTTCFVVKTVTAAARILSSSHRPPERDEMEHVHQHSHRTRKAYEAKIHQLALQNVQDRIRKPVSIQRKSCNEY